MNGGKRPCWMEMATPEVSAMRKYHMLTPENSREISELRKKSGQVQGPKQGGWFKVWLQSI